MWQDLRVVKHINQSSIKALQINFIENIKRSIFKTNLNFIEQSLWSYLYNRWRTSLCEEVPCLHSWLHTRSCIRVLWAFYGLRRTATKGRFFSCLDCWYEQRLLCQCSLPGKAAMKLGCSSKLSCYHHSAQLLCLRTKKHLWDEKNGPTLLLVKFILFWSRICWSSAFLIYRYYIILSCFWTWSGLTFLSLAWSWILIGLGGT